MLKTSLVAKHLQTFEGRSRNGSYQKDIGHGNRSGRDQGRRQDYCYDSDHSGGYGNRDYDSRGGGANNYDRSRPPKHRNYGVTVRVRGIPFSTTEDELASRFLSGIQCKKYYSRNICIAIYFVSFQGGSQ